MRHARPLLTGIAFGCACASGCRPVALLGRTGALRSDVAGWANNAPVGPASGDGEGTASTPAVSTTTGGELEAEVSLEFRGDHIEYSLRLRNPHSALVTGAYVTAAAGDRPESPVIVLFIDSRYRERFLEVRGTGTVPASMRASSLAEELRARPSSFVVTLRGGDFEEIWSGRLKDRR